MRYVGTARYDHNDSFGKFEQGSTLVLSRISYIASGLASLEDEKSLSLGDVLVHIKHQFHVSTCVIPHSEKEGTKPPYVCP
jgi:hypothetical protein